MPQMPSFAVPRLSLPIALMAALTASTLMVASGMPVDAARPTCLGKRATIVGTAGKDTIRGTRRADVIFAKGGNDVVRARGGGDRVCAGGGADDVFAGAGPDRVVGGGGGDEIAGEGGADRLRGQLGNDVVLGGDGDDTIDGGDGTDQCDQGAGTGTVTNCEAAPPPPPVDSANLAVDVSSPTRRPSGDITFHVTVTNGGPDLGGYTLSLTLTQRRSTCSSQDWVGPHPGLSLAAGASSSDDYVVNCAKNRKGAWVRVSAALSALTVSDPILTDNSDASKTNIR